MIRAVKPRPFSPRESGCVPGRRPRRWCRTPRGRCVRCPMLHVVMVQLELVELVDFPKENNFESALNRLEEISDLLENEDTPLEDSIKLFEEGIELKEFCEEKLKSAKLKIDKIVKKNKSLSSSEFK